MRETNERIRGPTRPRSGIVARGAATLLTIGPIWSCETEVALEPSADLDPAAVLGAAAARLEPEAPRDETEARGFIVFASGTLNQSAELQGLQAGRPDESRFREAIAILPDGRVGHELEHHRIDGTHDRIREVYEGGAKTIHLLEEGFSVRLTEGPEVSGHERVRRRFPHLLLEEARQAAADPSRGSVEAGAGPAAGPPPAGPAGGPPPAGPAALVPGGTRGARGLAPPSGLPLHLTLPDGTRLDLFFDAADTTLTAVRYGANLAGRGDARVRWSFADYRPVTGLGAIPHAYRAHIAGEPFLDMRVDSVVVDAARAEAFVAPPEGLDAPVEVPATGGDAAARAEVEELADGVYRVRNLRTGFHPLFVEFADFVAVMDAPVGYPIMIELPAGELAPGPSPDWLSRRLLELIAETLPGKPVRYVVLTHFHNDHAGGMRAFVAEGATVIAPAADEAAVRSFYAAPHRLAPDALAARPVPLSLDLVPAGGRRTIGDGPRRLDILSTGPNPHTEDMLIAHLPEARLGFVSDLMNSLPEDDPDRALDNPPLAFFLRWLDRQDFDSVAFYTMHGTAPIEPATWRRALARLGEEVPAER